ncbi:alpha-1A adrenergic receptor-like [Microcaecilia unicolor]|uniref:Alpha-1A adrenergic receptor n=1 Tax=Microcaecilia unicolor TaxID=1415580 RepID=A0A6P7XZB1_9AMPH|nr:alpha-1A adrenergic receptor-like [Microcaecilia unicolor]
MDVQSSFSNWSSLSELNSSANFSSTQVMPNTKRAILLSMTLGAFILFAIMGNILVILSVACHKHLRIVTNYFIINLAVADLLLSTIVLPFSASLEVLGYWDFGRVFCNIWAAIDVLCCTASIMSLCAISVDRYLGVSYPLRYPLIMTKKRGLGTLAGLWVLSLVISIGPLLGWKEPDPEDDKVCKITEEPGYALFSALGSFYLPLLIILVMYFQVYLAARKETKSLQAGMKTERFSSNKEEVTLRIHRKLSILHSPSRKSITRSKSKSMKNSISLRILKFSKEKKAAKTLGIVVGVFVLCWLPFFVVLPLGSFFPEYKPPENLFKIIFWLGYLNSCINPLIYPCFSQEFKRAFKRILKGQFTTEKRKHHAKHYSYCARSKRIAKKHENEQLGQKIRLTSRRPIYRPSHSDESEWKLITSLKNIQTFNRTTSCISYNRDYVYTHGSKLQADCLGDEKVTTSSTYENSQTRSKIHVFTFSN